MHALPRERIFRTDKQNIFDYSLNNKFNNVNIKIKESSFKKIIPFNIFKKNEKKENIFVKF